MDQITADFPMELFLDVSSADYRVLDHTLPHSRMEDGGSGLAGCARDDKTVIPSGEFPEKSCNACGSVVKYSIDFSLLAKESTQ